MAPWNAAMTTELNTLTQDFELILLSTEDKNNHELSKKLKDNLSNDFLDGSLLEQHLQKLLIQDNEEFEDRELSLDELEDLGGGLGLVDAMVSSSILMVIATQSVGLIGDSMSAMGKSQMRDGLNAAINADLELVRHNVADWAKSTTSDGQLTYNPDTGACDAGTLATALLADTDSGLDSGTEVVSLDNAPTKLQGVTINRTISVDPDNSNLIKISYSTSGGSIDVEQNASMITPAQGWCA